MYTDSYSLAKSMATLFLWLCKFTSVPFAYVCVHRSRAQKLFHIYIYIYQLAFYMAWFRNYMHGKAECHV